jgi:hypothetical protein
MITRRDRSELRRLASIHAYVGVNGSGKSLAMVHDTLRSLREGRQVFGTVELLNEEGKPHEACRVLESFSELLEVSHCDVLLDEVSGAVNSRAAMGLPVQFQNMLQQLRRRDVVLRWTAPNFARADTILRGVTQAVTVCKGFLPVHVLRCVCGHVCKVAGECAVCGEWVSPRLWPERRWFTWTTYDSKDWEEVTAGKLEKAKPLCAQLFRRKRSAAQAAYDTLAPVAMLDHLSEAGICAVCGGKRQHRTCKCERGQRL